MRMTRSEFVDGVRIYEKMRNEDIELTDALCIGGLWLPTNWIDHYYNMLSGLCDFSDEEYNRECGTDLDYFCFDLEFGRKWKPGMVQDDGVDIDLSTPEKLWDYIVACQKRKD